MMTLIILTIVILSVGAFIYGFVGNDFEKQNNKQLYTTFSRTLVSQLSRNSEK